MIYLVGPSFSSALGFLDRSCDGSMLSPNELVVELHCAKSANQNSRPGTNEFSVLHSVLAEISRETAPRGAR